MPHYRRREREKHQQRWHRALEDTLGTTRRELDLVANEVVPDDVLLAEVDHYLSPPGTDPAQQWFGSRLMGLADGELERGRLAELCRGLRPGGVPFAVNIDGRSPHRSRRPQK